MSAKYAFIAREEGNFPVVKMCVWANVSRSGYYEWAGREPSATARRRAELATLVKFSFERSDGTYGYRRVHAELVAWGYQVDDETVRAIMREEGLVACQPRPFRPTTTIAGDAAGIPDLLGRDFSATEPGARLVGDITYIPTWEGWVYLATVPLLLEESRRIRDGRAHAHRARHRRPGHGHPKQAHPSGSHNLSQ